MESTVPVVTETSHIWLVLIATIVSATSTSISVKPAQARGLARAGGPKGVKPFIARPTQARFGPR